MFFKREVIPSQNSNFLSTYIEVSNAKYKITPSAYLVMALFIEV